MDFEAFVRETREMDYRVYGAEVCENGVLTHSYGDTETPYPIYSAAKSVLSLGIGIAEDRGLIDLAAPLSTYLPGKRLSPLSGKQKALFDTLTLSRLLTMSVGDFPFRPEGESWLDFALNCPVAEPETRTFHYNNICAYLAGVALTGAIGRDAGDFLAEELFAPLEITDYTLGRCPEGYFYGASNMKLSARDLSLLGELLLGRGAFRGKRIVSEDYVKRATSVQQDARPAGYGYFFWCRPDGFAVHGKWGQRLICLPQKKMTIALLADQREDSEDLMECVERHLL